MKLVPDRKAELEKNLGNSSIESINKHSHNSLPTTCQTLSKKAGTNKTAWPLL